MPAGHPLDLDVREQARHLAVERPVRRTGSRQANSSNTGAVTRRANARNMLGGQPQLRLRFQALIGMPLKPARHLTQRAPRQHLGRGRSDLREARGALGDHHRPAAGMRPDLPRSARASRNGFGQTRRVRGRTSPVNGKPPSSKISFIDALGERRGEQHRDCCASANGRAACNTTQPSSSVTSSEITNVLPEVVCGIGRTEVALPMACKIERDDLAVRQQRRQQREAACVIEPTVRRRGRGVTPAAPQTSAASVETRQSKPTLDRHAFAQRNKRGMFCGCCCPCWERRRRAEALGDELLQAFLLLVEARARQEQHSVAGLRTDTISLYSRSVRPVRTAAGTV